VTAYTTSRPDGGQNGSPFSQSIRDNFEAIRQAMVIGGLVPGYDFSHNGTTSATPGEFYYREQSAVVTAENVITGLSRQATRFRITNTWSSGVLTKQKFEISTNAGSSYSNWTDPAGNYFLNYDYSSGKVVPFITWSTT
jgi:hypothetical protein